MSQKDGDLEKRRALGGSAAPAQPPRTAPELDGPPSVTRDLSLHLSEDELIGILLEDLPAASALAAALHVAQCEHCALLLLHQYEGQLEFELLNS